MSFVLPLLLGCLCISTVVIFVVAAGWKLSTQTGDAFHDDDDDAGTTVATTTTAAPTTAPSVADVAGRRPSRRPRAGSE